MIDYFDPGDVADKDSRVKYCKEYRGVRIEQCDHFEYTYEANESTHIRACRHCPFSRTEEHTPVASWQWNDDEKTAPCSIVCEICKHQIATPEVTHTNEVVQPSCVTNGSLTVYVSAVYNGETYETARNYDMPARAVDL